ncbi:MAG: hypothetical protein QM753_19770 [Thermomicrobiales bacterium]
MADKAREDQNPVVPAAERPTPSSHRRSHRRPDDGSTHPTTAAAYLEIIDPSAEAPTGETTTEATRNIERVPRSADRTIRSTPAVYRWVCPCQNPPVLLATYGPNARINIKVRDRYWHLHGFGMVEAICPRCAAEHVLDLRHLHRALESGEEPTPMRRSS